MTDSTLFDPPPDDGSISGRFWAFHHEHPTVLILLIAQARKARMAGFKVGAKMIWERLRWVLFVDQRQADGFKLNNSYTAHYARLAMREAPDLAGFFELRAAEADEDFVQPTEGRP